jgi:hypothetical protein
VTRQPRLAPPVLPLAGTTVPARVGEVAHDRAEHAAVTGPTPAQEA